MSQINNRQQSTHLQDTGSLIMNSSQNVVNHNHAATLYPMQSNHNSSAILAARPKATISQFSDKALLNYSAYQSVNSGLGGGNPIIVN